MWWCVAAGVSPSPPVLRRPGPILNPFYHPSSYSYHVSQRSASHACCIHMRAAPPLLPPLPLLRLLLYHPHPLYALPMARSRRPPPQSFCVRIHAFRVMTEKTFAFALPVFVGPWDFPSPAAGMLSPVVSTGAVAALVAASTLRVCSPCTGPFAAGAAVVVHLSLWSLLYAHSLLLAVVLVC